LEFIPPLRLNVVAVDANGILSLAFNRQIGLNPEFFERYKRNAEMRAKSGAYSA